MIAFPKVTVPATEQEDDRMSRSRTTLETVSTVLLTVAAVAVAGVYIYGQLAGGPGARAEVVEDSEVEKLAGGHHPRHPDRSG